QARKNRRCIHLNTLMIFLAEHGTVDRGSFATAERFMSESLLLGGELLQARQIEDDQSLGGTERLIS
ncbi:MAG TPA: hypothetical protein VF205_09540, partial [Nitrospiraceae bacterium]